MLDLFSQITAANAAKEPRKSPMRGDSTASAILVALYDGRLSTTQLYYKVNKINQAAGRPKVKRSDIRCSCYRLVNSNKIRVAAQKRLVVNHKMVDENVYERV